MATVAVAMAVLGLAVALIPAAGAERPTVVVNGQSPLPAPGATDVSPETIVRVRFSAPIDPATVSGSTFRLAESSTAVAVATGVALDVFGEVATLTPSARLRTSTSYTMSLTYVIGLPNSAGPDPLEEERPLRSPDGEVIRFAGALDVAVDPSGRVYVADFGEDGGSARVPGAVWMLEPDEEAPPTPGGGPAFVSASRAAAGGSSVSISRPTGLSTGHVLVAVVRQKKTTAAVTPPAGWTLIRSDSQSARSSLFFRVVTASEPSQYRFKVGTSAKLEGHILAYSGVDPADPVAASGVGSNTGTASGPTVVAPSLTPPLANTTYVAFWSAKASGLTVAAAAGTTERTDTSANATLATADETLSTTSPSGARTATLTSASDRRIGQAVLLRPAP